MVVTQASLDLDAGLERALRPGQDIVIGQAWGTPRNLVAALPRHADLLQGSHLFVGMLLEELPRLSGVSVETFFPSGPLGTDEGLRLHGASYQRTSLFDLARDFRTGRRHADVVLAQGSPRRNGSWSLGVTVDYVHAAAEQASHVVLESGAGVPWTGAGSVIAQEGLTVVDTGAVPVPLQRPSSERERAIAKRVADLIPDGATVQLGMAAWVEPLTSLLRSRRGLRVHSGMISDWVLELEAAGALDGAWPAIGTGAGGTERFYEWLDGTGRAELRPADRTHAPAVLGELPLLRSVNSVLEVDLRGNVNCEHGHGGRRGGVAGLQDFALAASAREDALSIIALTADSRGRSRLVARLQDAAISLPPGSVDVVVTEFGAADIRGLTDREKAAALTGIAAPEHRDSLRSRARNS
jgi:acetyl-CoA hydrolase